MNDWWRGAVIYQIYPRSFYDANGDGIGDLAGITEKLPYVADLGVDGIWLSPFFTSPMKDFGYDVADFRGVDPMFGTLADFDRLVARAHELGLKVVIDQVLSHTADTHPWFTESRSSRDNPRADWFVWADPKEDGTPPNNWLSVFGGSAWHWDPRRGQYYLHNFLPEQPDLNLRHRPVQDAVLDDVVFWLERGVDGLRLDTCNFYMHDAALRDNPPRPPHGGDGAAPGCNPYGLQWHVHDKSQPENLAFLSRLRAVMDRYPGVFAVAEIGDDHQAERSAEYVAGTDRLHTAYSFSLLGPDHDAAHIRRSIEDFAAQPGDGWPSWSLSNHDVPRVVSRWSDDGRSDPWRAKLFLTLLLSLRGTIFLYQGEELGLPEAELPYSALQDPYGKTFYPVFKGRDGCRTPMPWAAEAPALGFSTATPWLPAAPEHTALAVDRQAADRDAPLAQCRRLIDWRRRAGMDGAALRFRDTDHPLLAFERGDGAARWLCLFNLGPTPIDYALGAGDTLDLAEDLGGGARLAGEQVRLPAYGWLIARL